MKHRYGKHGTSIRAAAVAAGVAAITLPGMASPVTASVAAPAPMAAPRGTAARAGLDPSTQFYVDPHSQVMRWDAANPGDPRESAIARDIASQPQATWFSAWNPATVTADVQALTQPAAAAGRTPVLVVYEIPNRDCGGASAGGAPDLSSYATYIQNFAAGLGTGQVVIILEPDSLALQTCLSPSDASARDAAIASAVTTLKSADPAAKVYLDAGHSNWNSDAQQASVLRQAGVARADGIFSNVSNFMTTSGELAYDKQILADLGNPANAHIVIDTSRNGNGPAPGNPWCDPGGRALGQHPTANTGDPQVDAYLWVKPPGEADGCADPAGTFDPALASALITNGTGAAAPAGRRPAAHALAAGDWPTYHLDNARDGNATGLAPLSQLSVNWHAQLDGAVYGQPLAVGGRVLAATENDTVYALDQATGNVVWSTHVGDPAPLSSLPCGDINPLGITGTMVYDPATNRVFAVAETAGGQHTLVGLNADTGAVEVRVSAEPPQGDPIAHQQRGALTLLGGRVYIPYGGLLGDCGNYIGSVVSVATDGSSLQSYAVPTSREGGIWATAGGVADGDHLLYAVGNGASTTSYDGSDSVIALSADLHRDDFFAPSSWAQDNASDLDLGSMSPALVGPWVYAEGKRGTGYVLTRGSLGGIGGQVAQLTACRSFGGSAVAGSTVYLPCTDGPRAVSIGADGTPSLLWHASVPAMGSPVTGGGAVWVVDYGGGVLYALDPATGAVKDQVSIGAAPHFASPTLSGQQAYVGLLDGVVAVGGA